MRTLLLALIMYILSCNATAADLAIGRATFSLGQTESDARKIIEQNFKVISVGTPNDLVLVDPKTSQTAGTISFKNGRVSYLGRSWGNFYGPNSAVDSASALTSALESATAESGSTAIIRVETTRQPNAEFRVTHFNFSGRKISHIVSKSQLGGEQVAIDESVFP